MYNYQIITVNEVNQWITTDVNLLEMYKAALVSKSKHILWEKGVIQLDKIVGLIDTTPIPMK